MPQILRIHFDVVFRKDRITGVNRSASRINGTITTEEVEAASTIRLSQGCLRCSQGANLLIRYNPTFLDINCEGTIEAVFVRGLLVLIQIR